MATTTMSGTNTTVEHGIESIKALAAKVCETHNLSFIGFFQNTSHTFEHVVTEGIECTTPNGSFNSMSFNNVSNNSDIQHLISAIMNSSATNYNLSIAQQQKIGNDSIALRAAATSSPNHSLNLSSSSSSSLGFGATFANSFSSSNSNSISNNYKFMEINPHDKVDVKNYLYNCFEEFQQIPCKLLAKAWIKVIEPKKQSKYPYKLGDSSKPYWWPANCIHREPDHLKKDERINLLINILRIFKQKQEELIYAASLIQGLGPNNNTSNSALSNKPDFGHRKMEIMRDMFKVVNSQSTLTTQNMKVIKPGKKYSSSIYHKSKPHQKNSFSKDETPNNTFSTSKLHSILATPTSLENFPKQKRQNHINLPPIGNSNESYYGDLMEYIINKPDSNHGNIESQKHSSTLPTTPSNGISHLLQSPYVPSVVTKTIKKASDIKTPQMIHNDDESSEDNDDLSVPSKNDTPETVFPFLNDTSKNHSDVPSTPPTGIFKVYSTSASSKTLTPLSPSKINSMNQQSSELSKKSPKRFIFNNNIPKAMKVSKPFETPQSQIKTQLQKVFSSRDIKADLGNDAITDEEMD